MTDKADISIERGVRYYQLGTDYDVVLEERLVGRDDLGIITYESQVLNTVDTGKTAFEPGPDRYKYFEEIDWRVCIGGGLLCGH